MQAAENSSSRYTLGKNCRSEPGLISAVNTLFQARKDRAFVYEEIPFLPVRSPEKEDQEFLTLDGKQEAPLHIWLAGAQEITGETKAIAKGKAEP